MPRTARSVSRSCVRSRASTEPRSRATPRSSRCSIRSCSSTRATSRRCARSSGSTTSSVARAILLASQQKLAEIADDPTERAELYRLIARRWLEQFSNVQNATSAFEGLAQDRPGRPRGVSEPERALQEATRLAAAVRALPGAGRDALAARERLALMTEMAQLAAERLNRGDDAAKLYREILERRSDEHAGARRARAARRTREGLADARRGARASRGRARPIRRRGSPCCRSSAPSTPSTSAIIAGAVRAWRRVLELSPGHQRALRVLRDSYLLAGDYAGLEELYASQGDWEGLAEVLSNTADRAKESATKIELSYRRGRVYKDKLNQPDRAFRSYERILATDPNDTRAASELIPLYEADEKWARLPALYELLVERTRGGRGEARAPRASSCRSPASALNDRTAAARTRAVRTRLPLTMRTCSRRSRRRPARPARGRSSSKRSRSARRRSRRRSVARSSSCSRRSTRASSRGPTTRSPSTRACSKRTPTDEAAAPALEAILRREGRRDDLRWLLGLRVENAPSDDERARVLREWALLEEEVFAEPERAAKLARSRPRVRARRRDALRALPRLLARRGRRRRRRRGARKAPRERR